MYSRSALESSLSSARVAIEGVEQREENNADHAGGGKIPAPPEVEEHQA